MYKSVIHDLYIALCAHRPTSHLPSPYSCPPVPSTALPCNPGNVQFETRASREVGDVLDDHDGVTFTKGDTHPRRQRRYFYIRSQ